MGNYMEFAAFSKFLKFTAAVSFPHPEPFKTYSRMIQHKVGESQRKDKKNPLRNTIKMLIVPFFPNGVKENRFALG